MSVRLKRIDEGHYLVPGTDWEVVRNWGSRKEEWWVYEGNARVAGPFVAYQTARRWALRG